jgi:hypothetical protein
MLRKSAADASNVAGLSTSSIGKRAVPSAAAAVVTTITAR